jgi:hypothetical protein
MDWALGAGARGDYPARADAFLLLLPKGKPIGSGVRLTPGCVHATSMLPGPAGDPRVFLVVDGELQVLRQEGARPERLAGGDPSLRLTRLLAFDAAASPLRILAAALPEGAAEEQIWSLTVANAALLQAAPAKADTVLASREAFFAAYNAPRCLPGGRLCLGLSSDGQQTYIDVESTRGAAPQSLLSVGSTDVRDVTWQPGGEPSLYLLVGCS